MLSVCIVLFIAEKYMTDTCPIHATEYIKSASHMDRHDLARRYRAWDACE